MSATDIVLELSPYGFRIRVELAGDHARVLADDGNGWEDVGEARVTRRPAPPRKACLLVPSQAQLASGRVGRAANDAAPCSSAGSSRTKTASRSSSGAAT